MRSVLPLLLLLAGAAVAQEPTPAPLPGERAAVVLDGRPLLEVGEAGTWSPQQRAARIAEGLRAAADGSEPIHLELAERDGYPIVRLGDWHLLTIADSDVPPGVDPAEQAAHWMMVVEAALQRARDERGAAYRTAAAVRLVLVLLAALALHRLLRLIGHRLPARIARSLPPRRVEPGAGQPWWQLAIELTAALLQIGLWAAVAFHLCGLFPAARQVRWVAARLVGDGLAAPLLMLDQRGYSAWELLWLLAAAAAMWVVVTAVTALIGWRVARTTGTTRAAIEPATALLRYALLAVGLVVVLQTAGLDLSSLALLASVLGIGIGFGLQNIANNVVSGILMSLERPVKPGDFVALGELRGVVQSMGGRSTVIRTLDRVSIIVPNSQMLETQLVNWSHGDSLVRLHVPVGVAYGADLGAVRTALLDAARIHPGVLDDPRPEVRFTGFGDNALSFELLAWMADPAAQDQLQSDLNYQLEHNLRLAGIEVPFPQRTLHLPPAEIEALVARLHGAAPPPMPAAAANGNGVAFPASPWRALDLEQLAARMRGADGVAIADRRHLLSLYPRCFVGADAVDWLMRTEDLARDEAIRLGQRLVDRGLLHHVLDEHPFRDGPLFYRFYADEGR
jgi:small-conductance mechanosensitive channel